MTTSTSVKILSGSLHAAFAAMAIAVFSAGAQAAEPNQIAVQGSTTKAVGTDYATGAPVEQTTVKVAVTYDPSTLTTDSGVALLKESVADAARKACDSADPVTDDDDGTCVREAIESAQAQIARVVTQARSSTNG
jgi:UrcA family protein